MIIAAHAIKEKIRRKELYIVAMIGVLVLILFSADGSTISIAGKPITDYDNLTPIFLIMVNAICGALAIFLSLKTIPNEYERKTSHLVWIRGISQTRYHSELAIANGISCMLAEGIMFIGMILFTLMKHRQDQLWKLIPAYFIMALGIWIVSLLTSLLSIIFPGMVAGLIAAIVYLAGIFHSVLELFGNMVSGLVGKLLDIVLWIVPNLH